jgi:hypothetical protein
MSTVDQHNAKTADVLDAAADVLERDGWTRHAYYRDTLWTGPVCAYGALYRATSGDAMRPGAYAAEAATALGREIGGSPISFNDRPGQTKRSVVAAMRRTARKLRGAKR